jgi:hypothetical protein
LIADPVFLVYEVYLTGLCFEEGSRNETPRCIALYGKSLGLI